MRFERDSKFIFNWCGMVVIGGFRILVWVSNQRRPLQPCTSSAERISSLNRHAFVLYFVFFFEDVPDSAGVYMFDVVSVLFGIEQKGFF